MNTKNKKRRAKGKFDSKSSLSTILKSFQDNSKENISNTLGKFKL